MADERTLRESPLKHFMQELKAYEDASKEWVKKNWSINQRYKAEEKMASVASTAATQNLSRKINILWSNTQVIQPTLFSRVPSPVVQRRHGDQDVVARVSSDFLQRALMCHMEDGNWFDTYNRATLDLILFGRGVPWVVYKPEFGMVQSQDPETGEPVFDDKGEPVMEERVVDEKIKILYVFFDDFAHAVLKTWDEVKEMGWVARKVTMNKEQGIKRFGDKFEEVPLKHYRVADNNANKGGGDRGGEPDRGEKVAVIWEWWNAPDKKVYWFSTDYVTEFLDVKDDTLGLDEFLPCPQPLFGTLTNDTLIPVQEFAQYQHLADEVDYITMRINDLIPTLRLFGVYDGSVGDLGRVFNPENLGKDVLIPIKGKSQLNKDGSVGGTSLEGAIVWVPIREAAYLLNALFDVRDRAIAMIEQISGTADLHRSVVDPREKLGQSKIKMESASKRIRIRRQLIENSLRDCIRIVAEIMIKHFKPERLRGKGGFDYIMEVQQEAAKAEDPEFAVSQMFEAVMNLLSQDHLRSYRLDIETDSTIIEDQEEEKAKRVEFLEYVGGFVRDIFPVMKEMPELAPLATKTLMFGARGFRVGSALEFEIEKFAQMVESGAIQAPPPEGEEGGGEGPPAPDPNAMAQADKTAQQTMIDSALGQQKLRKAEAEAVAAETKAQGEQIDLQEKYAELQERILKIEKLQQEIEGKRGLEVLAEA